MLDMSDPSHFWVTKWNFFYGARPRQVRLVVLSCFLLLFFAGMTTALLVVYTKNTSIRVDDTFEIQSKSLDLLNDSEELERLYLAYKPRQPLDQQARLEVLGNLGEARHEVLRDMGGLRSLVADRPGEAQRVDQIAASVQTMLADLDSGSAGDGFASSAASFRALIAEFNQFQDRLLGAQEKAAERARSLTLASAVACLICSAAAVFAVLVMSGAYIRRLDHESELRAKAETMAARSQKIESLGQLAGGVAHDFNNLLTVIVISLDTLKRRIANLDQGALLEQPINSAMRSALRGADLTRRLLAFSRRQILKPGPINVNAVIRDLSDMLSRTVGEPIQIEAILADDLWTCFADQGQLENAILNLVLNARDAMPNGGRIKVETQNATLDQVEDVTPGKYVALSIRDTGAGMTEEVRNKAFEPFFTTKGPGGSGLGLAMIHGFVKQSHGHVRIDSELGRGAAVTIYLPVWTGTETGSTPRAAEPEAARKAPRAEPEVVLMVEDDEAVRDLSRAVLEELGYRIIVAPNAADALRILRGNCRVDVLFTDIILPGGMNGVQLADKARSLRRDLPVLFTTGYANDAIARAGRLDPGDRLLGKPYTQHDLANAIRACIDAPRPY
jgi:signal transduction histidine kinase/ActR/RegA family two-component response regulator